MTLLDAGPTFENRITLGQIATIVSVIAGFSWNAVRKYLRSEESEEKVQVHDKLLTEMQLTQTKIAGTQTNQQQLLEQQAKRLDRVEDHLFFRPKRNNP